MVGLGTATPTVGIIEVIAGGDGGDHQGLLGALNDRIGKRKELAALNYGLDADSSRYFPPAPSIGWPKCSLRDFATEGLKRAAPPYARQSSNTAASSRGARPRKSWGSRKGPLSPKCWATTAS